MREQIRQLVISARRATRKEPAEHNTPALVIRACEEQSLGADAVRLARIAAALHLDQAAKLRARMAAHTVMTSVATLDAPTLEVSP